MTAVELMTRYCDGDAEAFRGLYREVAPRLLGYLTAMAKSRAVAEDVLQATFLKVHRARAAYVRGADPVPWIYAIAHRTFLDEVRRKKRAAAPTDDGTLPEAEAALTGEPAAVAAERTAPDPEVTRAALAALAELPAAQRQAVMLTKLEGRSVAEAAAIAGTTPGRDEGAGPPRLRGAAAPAARPVVSDPDLDTRDLAGPLPPLPPALDRELAQLAPIAPRRPARQAAVVLVASLGWAMCLVGLLTLRRDLDELPRPWLVAYLVAWLLGFAVPLALVVLPARGQMLPRWSAAAAIAAIATIGFIVAGLSVARSGPSSLHLGLTSWAGCLSTGLATAVVPMALVGLALRGAAPAAPADHRRRDRRRGRRVGGFMLHLHCPIADAMHVGIIHGGVAVLAALVAALLLPRWLRG
jgi:RNA polymerase sigma factor (sigma-70 family)